MNNLQVITMGVFLIFLTLFVKSTILPLQLKVVIYIIQMFCILLCGYSIGKIVGESKKKNK